MQLQCSLGLELILVTVRNFENSFFAKPLVIETILIPSGGIGVVFPKYVEDDINVLLSLPPVGLVVV